MVENLIDLLVLVTMLSPILVQGFRYLQAKATDKRVKVLSGYALRIVTALQQNSDLTNTQKKDEAVAKLNKYIQSSPIKFSVTRSQAEDLIEQAVHIMKGGEN